MDSEKARFVVTVTHVRGVVARSQMDEKSTQTGSFPCGASLWGYAIAKSSEGVEHVRVSPIGSRVPQWIRVSEKDGTNPLVNVDDIPSDRGNTDVILELLANHLSDLNENLSNLVLVLKEKE